MSKTLEMLSKELIQTEVHIAESEGELTAHMELEYEQIQKDLATKTDHYGWRIPWLYNRAEFIKQKAQELLTVAKGIEAHADHMMKTAEITMALMGKKELTGEITRFSMRKSPKPTVVIDDSEALPNMYKRQSIVVKPDKEAIAEAIKMGETVKGAKLEIREYLVLGNIKKE